MKKVLWFSNFRFTEEPSKNSGTWIEAMGKGIVSSGAYELYNITWSNVDRFVRCDSCGVKQWALPIKRIKRLPMDALPAADIISAIGCVVNEINPDLIHVWGTERFWGLLTARKILKQTALLEMQGITHAMVPYMTGCLPQDVVKSCHRIKEWLRPSLSMEGVQREFEAAKTSALEMYAGHRYIDYHSEWVRSYLEPYVNDAMLFKTRMIVRDEYLEAEPWAYRPGNHVVFTSCGWLANKGLHVLLSACEMLRKSFPDIRLVVAGGRQEGIRRSGYIRWMTDWIRRSDVPVDVLGSIDSADMVRNLRASAVYVQPSLVESYSLSLAEAMAVGCPCVVSYAGAMPEVGGDACLYFPIADAGMCASRIRQVFELKDGASDLGTRAMIRSRKLHDPSAGVARQLDIYRSIIH